MAKVSTLTDAFTTLDTAIWNASDSGAVTAAAGLLRIEYATGAFDGNTLQSDITYDLTNSSILVQLADPGSRQASWMAGLALLGAGTNNFLRIYFSDVYGVTAQVYNAGTIVFNGGGVAYSDVTHRWMRIRETAGTLFFETSPNGTVASWTPLYSTASSVASWSLATVTVNLFAQRETAQATGGFSSFDNLNIPLATPQGNFFRFFDGYHANIGGQSGSGGGGGTGTVNDPTKIIYRGDYLTGDFSQFVSVQNVDAEGGATGGDNYPPPWGYPAAIFDDATYGKACRFELRDGDIPFSTTERTDVQTPGSTGGSGGVVRWYEFADKFDATFPNIANNWGLVNQFHGDDGTSSPPVGWYIDRNVGEWTLVISRQSSPLVFLSQDEILSLPLNRGNWQHITMRIVWSTSDTVGSVQVWHNHVRQTFTNGSQTYVARTLVGGGNGSYYKEGVYRDISNTSTMIIWHAGFRCCSDKTGLTWVVP